MKKKKYLGRKIFAIVMIFSMAMSLVSITLM